MKFSCSRKSLADSWSLAASVTPTRSPQEVLQSILVDASDGKVWLNAKGIDAALRTVIDGIEISKPGRTLLNASKVASILGVTTDANVSVAVNGNLTEIRGQRSRFTVPTSDPDTFPEVPAAPSDLPSFSIKGSALITAVKQTIFAATVDTEVFSLSGVFFEIHRDNPDAAQSLYVVSADGRRASYVRIPLEMEVPHEPLNFLLPGPSLRNLLRMVNADDQVKIVVSESTVYFETDRWQYACQQVFGRFPQWRQFFRHHNDEYTNVELFVDQLTSVIRQASVAATKEHFGVTLTMKPEGELCAALYGVSGVGDAEATAVISPVENEVSVTLNYAFAIEFLRATPDAKVTLGIRSKEDGVVFATEFGKYIVMPIDEE